MKTRFLLIPILLLCACRTMTAGTSETKSTQKPSRGKSELLLQKIVGGFEGEERKEGQFFECKVMNDVSEAADIKKWIAQLPRGKMLVGMHFRATSPSIQLIAYGAAAEPVVILADYSQIEQINAESPAEKNAVDEIKKIFEKYCPTPKSGE